MFFGVVDASDVCDVLVGLGIVLVEGRARWTEALSGSLLLSGNIIKSLQYDLLGRLGVNIVVLNHFLHTFYVISQVNHLILQ